MKKTKIVYPTLIGTSETPIDRSRNGSTVMRKTRLIAALLLIAPFAANADPIPASWSESVDFDIDFSVLFDRYTYTHDLTTDGFRPLDDKIFVFDLAIDLVDDFDKFREAARIDLPGFFGDRWFFDLSGEEFGRFSLLGRIQLNETGMLTVTIDRLYGDFSLHGSELTGRGFTSVPEPSTLALLGLGLLGMAARRRKTV